MTPLEVKCVIFIAFNLAIVLLRRPLAIAIVRVDYVLRRMSGAKSQNRPAPTLNAAVLFFFWAGIINAAASTLAFPAIRLLDLDHFLKQTCSLLSKECSV